MQMNWAAAVVVAVPVLAAVAAMPVLPWPEAASEPAAMREAARAAMPAYDKDRALLLPERYREWVLVGTSLGLSYNPNATSNGTFHETLMEPTAYAHFVETKAFREGTMLVLLLHGVESGELPGRRGQFAGAIQGVEMAVKDKARTPEGWAYYDFGGREGVARTAQPEDSGSCFSCHQEHAARDHVFLQFYPMLAEAAGVTIPSHKVAAKAAAR